MSDKSTRRKFLKLAGTGSAVALAGCSGNNAPDESTATETETSMESGGDSETETEADTETAEPSQGGTLRLASPGPVQTLDPINAKGSGAGYNQYQQSLLFFPDGDLPPQPMLAEDWEISNGGRTYTFQLKEGVSFHDGQEMTAQDWV
jgi:peptide/nickel transport system substrate-binding protein